jgi:hypothetical protein
MSRPPAPQSYIEYTKQVFSKEYQKASAADKGLYERRAALFVYILISLTCQFKASKDKRENPNVPLFDRIETYRQSSGPAQELDFSTFKTSLPIGGGGGGAQDNDQGGGGGGNGGGLDDDGVHGEDI